MTDLETLLQMRGIRYERARIEARSEKASTLTGHFNDIVKRKR